MILDNAITPAAAVDILWTKGVKVSERTLRERARKIGAYRQIGQAMFLLPEDLEKIMEPQECSTPSKGRKARSTSRAARSTESASKNQPAKLLSLPPAKRASGSPPKSSAVTPIPFRKEN